MKAAAGEAAVSRAAAGEAAVFGAAAGEATVGGAAVRGAAVSGAAGGHRDVQVLQGATVGKHVVSPLISQLNDINSCRRPGRSDRK